MIAFVLAIFKADTVSAYSYVAETSGELKAREDKKIDTDFRVLRLRDFFESYNSPLTGYADTMVENADRYGLDWRLVPAITGVESTFGKRIPYKSYNAYGWANGEFRFESWEDSIETVSASLRENYLDKGAASISRIARRYAPPSTTWGRNVRFFMGKIDPLPTTFDLEG